MDAENQELNLTRTCRDVEADRHILALALRQAAPGTVLTEANAQLTVTHVNDSFCDLTGQESDDLLGKPFLELLAPGFCDQLATWEEGPVRSPRTWSYIRQLKMTFSCQGDDRITHKFIHSFVG